MEQTAEIVKWNCTISLVYDFRIPGRRASENVWLEFSLSRFHAERHVDSETDVFSVVQSTPRAIADRAEGVAGGQKTRTAMQPISKGICSDKEHCR